MLTEVLVAISTIFFLIYIFQWLRSSRSLPPGPTGYPLVGSLPSIMRSPFHMHEVITKMAKTYGDLFTLHLPGGPNVVINSYGIAREALISQKDAFSGRPYLSIIHLIRGGKGLGASDFSKSLVLTRKICHSALRLYQPLLEGKILREAEEIVKRFQSYDNQPFDPKRELSLSTTNVICAITYGKRFDFDDPEFQENIELQDSTDILLGPLNILNIFPWLIHFPIPQTKRLYKVIEMRTKIRDARFFQEKNTFQENNIRHLVDALLQAKLDEERDDVTACGILFDNDIMATSDTIFGAGNETSATTLRWLIAYLLNFPRIQEHLYAEISEVFGSDGSVELKKRKSCHYLEATLTEVLRCASLAPLFLHKTTCDTALSGYHIPKDTTVLLNIWAINHDEREWEHPEEFNPDRFLDSEGHFTGTMKKSYITFGAGRRVCPGETLAKTELFLLSATLLQNFKFENPPGCPPPDVNDGTRGLIFAPKPFKVVAKKR